MNARIPLAALTLLALAACGDGDTTSPAGAEAVVTTTEAADQAADPTDGSPGATPVAGGPDATIPDGVPPEFLPAIGPVEVRGEALPILATEDVGEDPAVGRPAPVLVGLDFDGNPVTVDAANEGPTMVVFLAHWCPHCNDEIPRLNQLRDDGRLPTDLRIVGIATGSNPGRPNFPPGEWLVDKDWTFPAMADGIDLEREAFIAAEAYGLNAFPFVTLIGGDGDVVARWSGGREADETMALIAQHLGLT